MPKIKTSTDISLDVVSGAKKIPKIPININTNAIKKNWYATRKDNASILYINNNPNSIAHIPSNILRIETWAIMLHTENPSIIEANPNAIKHIPAIQDTASAL